MTPQDAWLFIRTHLLNEIAAGEADAREPIAVLDAHFTAGRGEKPDSVDSSDIDAMVNSSTGHAAGCPCGTCEVEGGLEICAKHCAVQKKTREEALELVLRNCLDEDGLLLRAHVERVSIAEIGHLGRDLVPSAALA